MPTTVSASDRDRHLENSALKVSQALEKSTFDLVVLPELSSIDYSRESFDALSELAEELEGPSFQCWKVVSRKYRVFIVYGFARRAENSTYISIGVVGPDGNFVGHYDKIHLAQFGASMEKDYFNNGTHLFTFSVKGFKLAPIICYDIRIPELSRSLAIDHNVDVILHCGAYYRDESFHTWHAFAVTRALENQLYFLSLNRAGKNYGNSIFCWPWMDEKKLPVKFSPHDEQFLPLELERKLLNHERQNYPLLTDRLISYSIPVISK